MSRIFELDDGTLSPTRSKGQVHIEYKHFYPKRESVPAIKYLSRELGTGAKRKGYWNFPSENIAECAEILLENGHRVTVAEETMEYYADAVDWEIEENNYPEDWDERRQKCYDRDNHTCQECGSTDEELHAHHITSISDGGSHDIENLTTLCKSCHEEVHGFEIF